MKYQAPYGAADPDAPYINGNPATGTAGSIPPAASIEHPQREIANFLVNSGLAPSELDLEQLSKAIQNGKVTYAADTGTANAMAITLDPAPDSIITGMRVWVKKSAAQNTGTVTLSVNGTVDNVKRSVGTDLVDGDLPADGLFGFMFDGVDWRVIAGLVPSQLALSNVAFPTEVRYPTPGTTAFIVPAGVYSVEAHVYGGGGGAGTGHATFVGGAGGGGGGYARERIATTPGASLTVIVGAGGAGGIGGALQNAGAPGGTSSFAGTVAATGGGGGEAGINPLPGTPTSSAGGIGSGGDVNLTGSTGGSGASGTNTSGGYTGYGGLGGNAGGPEGGSGGPMTTGSSQAGTFPGGGGSGGGSATVVGSNTTGGSGGNGLVIVRYVSPS